MARSLLHKRIVALLAALGVVVVLLGARSTEPTDAAWVDSETASATFAAGHIAPPVRGVCGFSGATLTPSWTPPTTGVQPTHYEYRIYRATIIGDPDTPWTTTTNTSFQHRFTGLIELLATYRFEIRAVSGLWRSTTLEGSATVVLGVLGAITISACSWSD